MRDFVKRYAIVVWLTVVFGIVILLPTREAELQSSVFCAYGKVFVEFEEGNKKWGTIMLNDNGKPILCTEPTGTPVVSKDNINNI